MTFTDAEIQQAIERAAARNFVASVVGPHWTVEEAYETADAILAKGAIAITPEGVRITGTLSFVTGSYR